MAWKKLHNTDQDSDNMFVMTANESGCCDGAQTMCEYTIDDVTVTSDVASVTIDGTVYTFTTAADTAAEIKAGLAEALTAAGYVDVDGVGISVVADGAAFDVDVVTEATLTTLTKVNASTQTFTQKCTKVRVCDYEASFATLTPGDVGYDGSTESLANSPYSGYTSGEATQLAADIGTALTTLGAPYYSVSVAVNSTADGFDVTVRAEYGTEITIGAKTLSFCYNCQDDYKA